MHRKSKQKEAIIGVLKNTSSHPCADWIYEQVRKEIPNISLGTVYRNLRLLKEAGTLSEFGLSDGIARFDGNTRAHYHFRCDRCGRVFDLDEPVDKTIEARIARKTGFTVTNHRLELSGLCLDCQQRQETQKTSAR